MRIDPWQPTDMPADTVPDRPQTPAWVAEFLARQATAHSWDALNATFVGLEVLGPDGSEPTDDDTVDVLHLTAWNGDAWTVTVAAVPPEG